MRIVMVSGLLTVVLAISAHAQGDRFAGVEITATPVAGAVHMLEGQGGNIGVSAGDDGVLMIDSQFLQLADKIKAAISDISDDDIVFLINTHHHGDHAGGNPGFGATTHIIGHTNVRSRLAENSRLDPVALPIITYEQEMSVYFNGEEIRIEHYPVGHTDTDSIIYFTDSNVIHMGDHMFNGQFPFIDLASGGTVDGYIENVGKVLDWAPDDVNIIPGHGELATKDDLKAYHEMLVTCRDLVKKQVDAGADLDAIREEGVPDQYRDWGQGFISTDRWLATLYRGLGGE